MQDADYAEGILKAKPSPEMLQARAHILDQLASIHDRITQVLSQNEHAAPREQMPHLELVVDSAVMGGLKALGQARVAALRAAMARAGLNQSIIWDRLKQLGWDTMEVHQTTLTGIRSNTEASSPFR